MIIDMRNRPPVGQYLSYFAEMIPESRRPEAHLKASMDLWFKEMKSAGITQCVAAGGSNPGMVLGKKTIPPRCIENGYVVEVQNKWPERIIGCGGIDPSGFYHDPVKEVEKCHKLGLKGVFMEPGRAWLGSRLNDARLYPIYQKCSELGMFINPQTSGPLGGDNIDWANPKYVDQVAGDFPDLTIICCHGCYPYLLEIASVCLRREHVYTCPDLYIKIAGSGLYVETANATFNIGAKGPISDKIIFGTAYPYANMKEYTEWFLRLPLKDDVKEKILYKNAIRAMKLDESKYPTSW